MSTRTTGDDHLRQATRWRRRGRWAWGCAVCFAIALLLMMVFHVEWGARTTGPQLWVLVSDGAVRLAHAELTGGPIPPGLTWRRDQAIEMELVPVFRSTQGMFYARLPMWIPLVLAVAAATWFERRARRCPVGVCRNCGYDLSGRGDAARCPECGATVDRTPPSSVERDGDATA